MPKQTSNTTIREDRTAAFARLDQANTNLIATISGENEIDCTAIKEWREALSVCIGLGARTDQP